MHSQPALVDNAYWCGEVAASTAWPNCWAMVRATSLRTTSPATMPRTLPSGFVKAVILPNLIILTTDWGTSPLTNFLGNLEKTHA